ncbi:SMC-Scp complex subunit ScpB [Candidatus Uhrbacteria bacterium]|nr:SMC-Scp complex subunit ScpB [Candidatus Uhrbacteria bacterium]
MSLSSRLEAVLFAVAKPLSRAQLARALGCTKEEVGGALTELVSRCHATDAGVCVLETGEDVQLVSNPAYASDLEQFVKQDAASELTRPALETLTVIAYRGPMTKPEIEQVRGVNCTLILRHLLMRDMVVEEPNEQKMQPTYRVSPTLLRHLGCTSVVQLPNYTAFAKNEDVARLQAQLSAMPEDSV